jgi:hypothetical protein
LTAKNLLVFPLDDGLTASYSGPEVLASGKLRLEDIGVPGTLNWNFEDLRILADIEKHTGECSCFGSTCSPGRCSHRAPNA